MRDARHDPRLQNFGKLVGYKFEEHSFPLEPRTAFYDRLYITALAPHVEWLRQTRFNLYKGFTDIEFNPQRSLNCQARSCALFVTLMTKNILDEMPSSRRTHSWRYSRAHPTDPQRSPKNKFSPTFLTEKPSMAEGGPGVVVPGSSPLRGRLKDDILGLQSKNEAKILHTHEGVA